jgi:hypothetical protein
MLSELELNGVQSCHDEVIVQFNPTILNQLTKICFMNCVAEYVTQTAIDHLSAHCFGLTALTFGSGCSAAVKNDVILKLVAKNKHLQLLSLGDYTDDFPKLFPVSDAINCAAIVHALLEPVIASVSLLGVWIRCVAIRLMAGPTHSSLWLNCAQTSQMEVASLLICLPQVTEIQLQGYCMSTHLNSAILNVITSKTNLTALTVCLHLDTEANIRVLFEKCPKLTTLVNPYCGCVCGSFRIWPTIYDPSADKCSLAAHFTGRGMRVYPNNNFRHVQSLLNTVPRLSLLEIESDSFDMCQIRFLGEECRKKGVQLKWM